MIRWLRLRQLNKIRRLQAEARQLHIDSIIMLVGQTTMTWASAERLLDELIAWYQHAGTDLSAKHPKNLSDKVKYLRKMQSDERLPVPLRTWVGTVRSEAKALAERRHELVHGLLWRRPLKSGEWQSQRVIYDGALARLRLTRISDDDFRQILRDISDFIGDLSPKVWVITKGDEPAFPPSELEKARQELGLA